MEGLLIIIVILLILIYFRLGIISEKLNVGIEQEERERQTRTLDELLKDTKDLSNTLDNIEGYLEDIERNTDADYQKKRDEERNLT